MKEAVVIHSGGMDSSICLALAIQEFGKERVMSLTFDYGQRHAVELTQAKKICEAWGVDQRILSLDNLLLQITSNALIDKTQPILYEEGLVPNTLVVGRNGLMARLGAIFAQHIGVHRLYMGVIEVDYYRDCSRHYIDLKEQILRLDLNDSTFEIRTPLVYMTKAETLEVAYALGVLDFLLEETVTCYEGIRHAGCGLCPACILKQEGILQFLERNPDSTLPYSTFK